MKKKFFGKTKHLSSEEFARLLFIDRGNLDKPSDECWEWQGELEKWGYGLIRIRRGKPNSFFQKAHRYSYEYHTGQKIPEGMSVCHHCDNRKCVNPEHLFIGTAKDNSDDKIRKGRHFFGDRHREVMRDKVARGERNRHAKLTEDGIRQICEMREAGMTYKQIAEQFNVDYTAIYKVCKGKRWKHVEREVN